MKSQLKHFKYWLIFLIFCLSYFFLLVSNASSESLIGKVIAVHDGDTITLQNESGYKKIRLAGIDAPELKQPYGAESRAALRAVVFERQVQVDATKSDKYGRWVGKVILDGQDINLQHVQAGMAWVYRDFVKELSKEDKVLYLEAEHLSKKTEVGLWKETHPVTPWVWRQK